MEEENEGQALEQVEPVPETPLTRAELETFKEDFNKRIEEERRTFQSTADKRVAVAEKRSQEAERLARQAQEQAGLLSAQVLESLDPDSQMRAKAALYDAGKRASGGRESAQTQSPREVFGGALEEWGVNPDDPEIDYDYIQGAPSFRDAMRRLSKTAKQIQSRANQPKAEESPPTPPKEKPTPPSVETGIPSGGGGAGIPTTIAGLREWIKTHTTAEWKEKEAIIDRMLAEGRIK